MTLGTDAVTLDSAGMVWVSGVETLTGSSGADIAMITGGAVRFQGGTGADIVVLAGDGAVDQVVYASPEDGTAAGVRGGFDQVVNFRSGEDQAVIYGALRGLVDRNGDWTLSGAVRDTGEVNLNSDEVVQLATRLSALDDEGFAGMRAAVGLLQGDATGKDFLVLASDGASTGLYLADDRDGSGVLDAQEVRLISAFVGTPGLAAGDLRLG